jgi:hypothetical protein
MGRHRRPAVGVARKPSACGVVGYRPYACAAPEIARIERWWTTS